MKVLTKLAAFPLALAIAVVPVTPALATSAANQTAVTNGLGYLSSQQGADGQIAGYPGINYWSAIAYAAAGTDPAAVKVSGGTSLLSYLVANPPVSASANDYARDILAIVASGQNPYSFGGTNYVSALEALHTGGQMGDATATNDDIFSVLALLAAGAPGTNTALTDALSFALAHQHADGGFSYTTDAATGSDVDDTASAIMALKAATSAGLTINAGALTNARTYLLSKQNADGGFLSDPVWGTDSNVSSSSWALMAFNALGEAGTTPGTDAQAYLRGTQQPDGSFPYMSGAGDTYDTASAVAALTGNSFVVPAYDGPIPQDPGSAGNNNGNTTPSPTPTPSPSPSASPSSSPSPSATPSSAPGSVLGASTGAGGSGGILPTVGSAHALAGLATALGLSLLAATFIYLHARRKTNPQS